MTFPIDRIPDIKEHPEHFKLLEVVPLTTFAPNHFPIVLAPEQGNEVTIVIVDVETTGFDVGTSDVIELGLTEIRVQPDTGLIQAVRRTGSHYIDPGYPIPEVITEITGITNAMVHGQTIENEVFADWFAGDPIVMAHNAKFDRSFMHKILPASYHQLRWVCSMSEAQWITLGYEGNKLEYLNLKCGYFYEGHRASIDCLATAWLLHLNPDAMMNILEAERAEQYLVKAIYAPYQVKDTLKERGYRWDAENKVWHTTIDAALLGEEKAFLAMTYPQGDQKASITRQDSRNRFL